MHHARSKQFCKTDGGRARRHRRLYRCQARCYQRASRDRPLSPIDIRAPTDMHRKRAVADIVRQIETIAKRRELALQLDVTHENRTVPCADWLKAQVAEAVAGEGFPVFELPSGAGHDGMAMIDIADVAMIFVRCRGGISHHPDEHVELADADAGRPRIAAADRDIFGRVRSSHPPPL